jgi:hypothetical protein
MIRLKADPDGFFLLLPTPYASSNRLFQLVKPSFIPPQDLGQPRPIHYLLCEAANAVRRTHSTLRDKYPSLVPRKGHKKAIIAVAHKMIRTIVFVLTRREAYRDPGEATIFQKRLGQREGLARPQHGGLSR